MAQPALHGAPLVEVVAAIAAEVQRVRTLKAVLDTAAAGLEQAGYLVGVVTLADDETFRPRYVTRPALGPLEDALRALPPRALRTANALSQALKTDRPVLTAPLGAAPNALPAGALAVLQELGAKRAALLPLRVWGARWGALAVVHEDLAEADLPALQLLGLQVGAAIEVAEAAERLTGREVELRLAHELAVAGASVDAEALLQRALAVITGTTQSEVAVLHRHDPTTDEMVLVGAPYNYRGVALERYRRFKPLIPMDQPQMLATARLPPEARAELSREDITWLAIVPLNIGRERFGLLTLARRAEAPYSANELQSAETLGVQIAAQLQRARLAADAARLYADVKQSYDELGRAQAELVRHERLAALGELAAVMAHEVRNPLGVIFNSLTTLRRLLTPSGDAQMLFDIVGEEAERLNRIVSDLLDFVRPYELAKKPTAIEPLIASAISAATQVGPAGVRVVTEGKDLPLVPVDAHLLRQALVNLLTNAVQAMPRGGQVTVRASTEPRAAGAWLVLEVQDEGLGLSPRAAERIFQPFFTTKATGTGLGLAVVKRIVDAHLGEVSVAPATGGGTVFVVKLPG